MERDGGRGSSGMKCGVQVDVRRKAGRKADSLIAQPSRIRQDHPVSYQQYSSETLVKIQVVRVRRVSPIYSHGRF